MVECRQSGEGPGPHALMAHTFEKSDAVVVPGKSANTRVTPVESMEGRTKAKGIPAGRNAPPTQSGTSAPTDLQRVGDGDDSMPVSTKVGARCGKSARRVLSGGRPEEGRPYRNGSLKARRTTQCWKSNDQSMSDARDGGR